MGAHALPGRVTAALALAVAIALAAAAPAGAARPTGRHLVTFEKEAVARSSSTLGAVLSRTGVRRAGRGVPRIGVATVRGPAAAIARLRRDPAVRSVSVEWERDLRRVPSDPALTTPETEFTSGVPPGTPIQWALARQGFPRAWDTATGAGAVVGVLDTGADGTNPELAGKMASADAAGASSPLTDEDGHGTHTAGLACAATDNGIGLAGAGFGCRLAVVKLGTTITGGIRDEDIVDGIRIATDRGADAINMSFGGGVTNAVLRQAIEYAVSKGVVLVASASNGDVSDQGAPAVELQPGDAPNLGAGRGLVVTAAEFDDTRAATGFGGQISLAAYGFFDDGALGPPGLISAYPRQHTPREGVSFLDGCQCRRALADGDYYGYLQGTSMSAPQVAGLAALISDLNPFLSLRDKLTLIKQSARRQGGWSPELGWGIIDAGAAVEAARRIDRLAPSSKARGKRRVRLRRKRSVRVRLRWSGSDTPGRAHLVPSGVARYTLYMKRGRGKYRRVRRSTTRRTAVLRLRRGVYRFYTRSRDRAGNLEAKPRRADLRLVAVAR
jgi:subtilisin family serine protease